MIDLTKYELKPIYKNNVLDHYGLVPKAEPAKSVANDSKEPAICVDERNEPVMTDRTLEQIAKETCEWEQTCQID